MNGLRSAMGARAELDARRLAAEHRVERARPGPPWSPASLRSCSCRVLARAPALQAPDPCGDPRDGDDVRRARRRVAHARSRFADSQRLRDLLAMAAVGTLGLIEPLRPASLPALATVSLRRLSASPPSSAGQLIVAGLFAAAAFTSGSRLVTRPRRLVALTIVALGRRGARRRPGRAPARSGPPRPRRTRRCRASERTIRPPPRLCILAIALLGVIRSAPGLRRRPRALRTHRPACWPPRRCCWRPPASTSSSAACRRIGTVAPMQLPSVCAFALVLLAATRHEPQARARVAEAAALAERRRVARDLHDGLAQDLAFIAAHGPALSEELGDDHPLVIAAAAGACHLPQHHQRAVRPGRGDGGAGAGGRRPGAT